MNKTLLALLAVLLGLLSFAQKAVLPAYTVTVDAGSPLGTVSPSLMGFNIVYAFEGDAAWGAGKGKVPLMLKAIGAKQLRYPGGTVATFYHWENPTGQGWADAWNPSFDSTRNRPASATMDIDEYLGVVKQQGTEPLVGINMGSGMKYNRVEEGIAEAVRLMKHCQSKGVKVTYWYLDNEPYQRDANFTFTAEQYAEAVNRYVPRMKEVDPAIKIIVNTHPNQDLYTKTLLQKAGQHINLVDVHMYWKFRNATFENWKKEPLMMHRGLHPYKEQRELWKKVFAEAGYPDTELVILEWNIGPPGPGNTPPTEHQAALMVAEQFAQYAASGLKMACFWPVSWPEKTDWISRSLLRATEGYRPNKMYAMFTQYTGILGQQQVQSTVSAERLVTLAVKSNDGNKMWLYLINKNQEGSVADVAITVEGFVPKSATAAGFTADDKEGAGTKKINVLKRSGNRYAVSVPQNAFVKIEFKK